MVSIYGMSDKIGTLSFYDSTGQSDFSFTKPYSEKTAELIDAEVKEMVSAASVSYTHLSHSRKNSNTCCFGSFCQLYPGCNRRKDDHHESQHDHTSKMRYIRLYDVLGRIFGYLHIKRNRFIRAFLRERFNRPPLIYSLPAQNKRYH